MNRYDKEYYSIFHDNLICEDDSSLIFYYDNGIPHTDLYFEVEGYSSSKNPCIIVNGKDLSVIDKGTIIYVKDMYEENDLQKSFEYEIGYNNFI